MCFYLILGKDDVQKQRRYTSRVVGGIMRETRGTEQGA